MRLIENSPLHLGMLSGVLAMLAADAGHWFVTPHPDASGARTIMVAIQLIGAVALSIWAWRKGRALEQSPVRTVLPARAREEG